MHNQQICMYVYIYIYIYRAYIVDGFNKSEAAFFSFICLRNFRLLREVPDEEDRIYRIYSHINMQSRGLYDRHDQVILQIDCITKQARLWSHMSRLNRLSFVVDPTQIDNVSNNANTQRETLGQINRNWFVCHCLCACGSITALSLNNL